MAISTTNLGLIKPERSDNYNVDVMAGNMDIIDERVGALEENISFDSSGNIVGNVKGNVFGAVCVDYGVTSTQPDVGLLLGSFSGSFSGSTGQSGTILTFDIPEEIGTTSFGLGIKNGVYTGGSVTFKVVVTRTGGTAYDTKAQVIINGTTYNVGSSQTAASTTNVTFTPIVGTNTISGKITMGTSWDTTSQRIDVSGNIYLIPA